MEAVRLQRAVRDRSSPERPDWDAAVRRGTSCVVLCGKRVATAWGIAASRRDFLRRFDSGCGHLVYLLPHPSGVNRWWNEERNRTAARLLLEGLGARHG